MIIEFPEYTPDLPPINNPGMTVANNVIPAGSSYTAVQALVAYSDAINAYPRGTFYARESDGDSANFVGNETKLYKMISAAWTDVSIAGGYTLGSDESWDFTQFGSKVIAVNYDSDMQYVDIDSGTLFSNLSADATRPKSRYVDVVKDFVVVSNTTDAVDGSKPYRVRWSAVGDSTSWTVNPTTQADYQDLDSANGWIYGFLGGETGTILQERAITVMSYVAPPAVFEFKLVERDRGTVIPRGSIKIGNLIYYIGLDGFYVFDGYQSTAIGINKVDKTFLAELNTSFLHRVNVAVNQQKQVIAWSYPDQNTDSVGTPTRVIYYNYSPNATKRWSTATITQMGVSNLFTEGYVMDPAAAANSLDTWQTANQGLVDLDQLPYSLDSRIWTGNDVVFAAFNSDNKFATFTGTPLTAVLETPEVQLNDKERTNVILVRPVVDGNNGTVTIQIGTRNLQNESVTFGSALSVDSIGNVQCRSNARYHRVRVNITDDGTGTPFSNAIGIEVLEERKAGLR